MVVGEIVLMLWRIMRIERQNMVEWRGRILECENDLEKENINYCFSVVKERGRNKIK